MTMKLKTTFILSFVLLLLIGLVGFNSVYNLPNAEITNLQFKDNVVGKTFNKVLSGVGIETDIVIVKDNKELVNDDTIKIYIDDTLKTKQATFILKSNTYQCLTKCEAYGETTLHEQGYLFDKIELYDKKQIHLRNGTVNIAILKERSIDLETYNQTCANDKDMGESWEDCINGSRKHYYNEYEIYDNSLLPSGVYNWRMTVNKRILDRLDWIPTVFGTKLIKFAQFGGDWSNHKNLTFNINFIYINETVSLQVVKEAVMNSTYTDLRFVDKNDIELSYWMQEFNSSEALIWLRLPENNNITGVTMYYGNENALNVSNIHDGHALGDSYNQTTGVDPARWTTGVGSSCGGGICSVTDAGNYFRSIQNFNFTNATYMLEQNMIYIGGSADNTFTNGITNTTVANSPAAPIPYTWCSTTKGNPDNQDACRNDVGANFAVASPQMNPFNDYMTHFMFRNDTFVNYTQSFANGTIEQIGTRIGNGRNGVGGVQFGVFTTDANSQIDANWTRMYVTQDPRPVGTFGIEMSGNSEPTVNLINPPDTTSNTSNNHLFFINTTEDGNLENATLYHNISGSWIANQTTNVTGTFNESSFNVANIPAGIYTWNVEVCDDTNLCNFADANFTFEVTSALSITLIDRYAINSSNGRLNNQWNTSNLDEIEALVLNFTINNTANDIDTWLLNFTANGTNACSLGNKQDSICYNLTNADPNFVWISFQNNTDTLTFDGLNRFGGDGIFAIETSGTTDNLQLGITIDEHYNPNVFKYYDAQMNFSNRTLQDGTDQRITRDNILRIRLNDSLEFVNIPTDATEYKLDLRVNTSGNPTDPLLAFLCNSTYSTGDPETNSNCALVGEELPSELQDDGTKFRAIFTNNTLITLGDLEWVVLLTDQAQPSKYYALNTFGITNASHVQSWEYSTDKGTTWLNANDGFETELNINWFDAGTETSFEYNFWANDTGGNSLNLRGNITWDMGGSFNLKPLIDLVTPEENSTIQLPNSITWLSSDPNNDNLNISIFTFKNGVLNETLVTDMNQSNVTFDWQTSIATGTIDLVIEVCELGTSELFCVNNTHNIFLNMINLTGLTFNPIQPKTNETTNVSINYLNGDLNSSDITANFSVDGVEVSVQTQLAVTHASIINFTLSSSNYVKGQNVSVIINATDTQGFNGSISSSFIVGDVPPNAPVIDLVGNDTFNHLPSILINWTNSTDIDGDTVNFEIYISTNQTLNLTTIQANSTSLEFNYSTIPEGVNYYKVRANSAGSTSSFTPTLLFTQDTSTIKNFTQAFLSPVVELSTNPFNITIQVNNATVTNLSINLTYNFTNFIGTVTHPTNETYFANFNIPTPTLNVQTNITFGYNISAQLFNSTSESNQSITTFGQIVNPINFFQCNIVNATSFQIYNFTMFQEIFMNGTLLNTTISNSAEFDANFILWQDGNGGTPNKTIAFDIDGSRSVTICMDQNEEFRIRGIVQYKANQFDTREWHSIGNYSIVNNSNLTELQLYPIVLGTAITIKIVDETSTPLVDIITDIERYNIGNASYFTVDRTISNSEGKDNAFLRQQEIFYRFTLYNLAGDRLFQSENTKLISTSLTLIIKPSSVAKLIGTIGSITHTLENISGNIFRLIYNDPSGEITNHCLSVIHRTGTSDNFITGGDCNTCSSLSSTTLDCAYGSINGTYIASYYTTINPSIPVATLIVSITDDIVARLGADGLLIGFIVTGTFGTLGLAFGSVAVMLMGIVSLIAMSMLGFVRFTYPIVLSLIIMGITTMIILAKKEAKT